MNTPLPLRPNVCILLFRDDQKLFLGERLGSPGVFQFPQGGIEDQGDLVENVYRELSEELGLERSKVSVEKVLSATHQYDWDSPPDYARGRWRGQDQRFVLVRFLGEDSDISVNTADAEFMSYRWCNLEDVCNIAEPKRINGYRRALEESLDYFKSLKFRMHPKR